MALYAWGTAELYGKWPGVYPEATEVINGVTYKVFPYDITEAASYNLIFNNGNNGQETPSFEITEARDYFLVVTAEKMYEVGSAIDNTTADTTDAARKFLHDGVLYIERAGKIYNAQGQYLK